jgi:tRNA threonylcarbamoyladenosine biosynthesis protein TsaB
MDEVYSAAYRFAPLQGKRCWQAISSLQVSAPENMALPESQDRPASGAMLLAGNAFAPYGERLISGQPDLLRCTALPTAAALVRLAPAFWAQGMAVPADQAMPLYIRDKVAHTTAEREALKAQALHDKAAQAAAALPSAADPA